MQAAVRLYVRAGSNVISPERRAPATQGSTAAILTRPAKTPLMGRALKNWRPPRPLRPSTAVLTPTVPSTLAIAIDHPTPTAPAPTTLALTIGHRHPTPIPRHHSVLPSQVSACVPAPRTATAAMTSTAGSRRTGSTGSALGKGSASLCKGAATSTTSRRSRAAAAPRTARAALKLDAQRSALHAKGYRLTKSARGAARSMIGAAFLMPTAVAALSTARGAAAPHLKCPTPAPSDTCVRKLGEQFDAFAAICAERGDKVGCGQLAVTCSWVWPLVGLVGWCLCSGCAVCGESCVGRLGVSPLGPGI